MDNLPCTVEGYRLSSQQTSALRLQELLGHPPSSTVVIAGLEEVSRDRLAEALESLSQRHEILRTLYQRPSGFALPLQVIVADSQYVVRYVDDDEARTDAPSMDLSRGPVLLVTVSREKGGTLQVQLTAPWCALDRTGMRQLARELLAELSGLQREAAELLQYADYSEWQNGVLESELVDAASHFWREALDTAQVATRLPFELKSTGHWPQPAVRTDVGDLDRPLRRIATVLNASLKDVALAIWTAFAAGLAEDSRVLCVIEADCRTPEVQGVLGPFTMRLPLRCKLAEQVSLREHLAGVRLTLEQCLAYKYGFQERQDATEPQTYYVGFRWTQADGEEDPAFRLLPSDEIAQERLALDCDCSASGIQLALVSPRDGFLPGAVRSWAGQLEAFVLGLAANLELPLAKANVLSPKERQYILEELSNASTRRSAQTHCLHHLFVARAALVPEAIAVEQGDRRLRYGELDVRSNQVANRLRAEGIGPEDIVGVYVERSIEAIVAIVGVLKAGAAYLPLDPSYPLERLAWMSMDAGIRCLLSDNESEAPLQFASSAHTIHLGPGSDIWTLSTDLPVDTCRPENLAYVIYTSGSSGRPKGVLINHAGAVASTMARHSFYTEHVNCFLLLSSFSFDSSVAGLFWTLTQGGRLYIPTAAEHHDTNALAALISSRRVSHLLTLPSFYTQLLDSLTVAELRCVVVAGEVCGENLPIKHYARLADTALVNEYGPTETTVWATAWPIPAAADRRAISIGRPVSSVQTYILDSQGEIAPIGRRGEIAIGGPAVARGYLNRPDLTAEKFVPDPFADEPGQRVYKTSDLGRLRPDGALEFLGRIDRQVKIRGYRIEPEEIQVQLGAHPMVKEAAVMARTDGPGEGAQLVGYVVLRGSDSMELARDGALRDELIAYLSERLPPYMVPQQYVCLDALPLMPNGKLDSSKLPTPFNDKARENRFKPPRNRIESILVNAWQDVLGLDRIGIQENIFELGGDSIRAIQILSRLSAAGIRLTLNQFFEHQTIEQLAQVATVATDFPEESEVSERIPLTPVQQWFFEQNLTESHQYNQSVMLKSREPIDRSLLSKALTSLVSQHEALRLRFNLTTAGREQSAAVAEQNEILAYEEISGAAEAERQERLEAAVGEVQASLNLSTGPLLRARVFSFEEGDADVLLIVIHHLAVDGVSWGVLLEDLHTAYLQLRRGEPVTLPAKTCSWRTWARKLEHFVNQQSLDSDCPYWESLREFTAGSVPVDFPDGSNLEGSIAEVSVRLEKSDTARLLACPVRALARSAHEVLLAALSEAVARWTGSGKVLLDVEGHGREELLENADVSRTVGWFTALYPLAFDFERPQGARSTFEAVRRQLDSLPRRGVSFGLLKYMRNNPEIRERLQALPRADIVFGYLGQVDPAAGQSMLFEVIRTRGKQDHSPRQRRRYGVEVIACISNGSLNCTFLYGADRQRSTTVEALADAFIASLRAQIALDDVLVDSGRSTASFPLAQSILDGLDKDRLDPLLEPKSQVQDIYPLTPLQQGMLYHCLYAPESALYVNQTSFVVRGELQVDCLEHAWQAVVDRNPVLRTAFLWKDVKETLQVVSGEVKVPFHQEDWRGISQSEQAVKLQDYLEKDRRLGFDLTRAPLLRLTLIRRDVSSSTLVWTFHHLLLDGWSVHRVFREVFLIYEAACRKRQIQLPATLPYSKYIEWVRRQDPANADAFWRGVLPGFTTPSFLAALPGRSELSNAGGEYRERWLRLSRAATAALEAMARKCRVTLNTLVQGAWALLISRHTRQQDVMFGVVVSGRSGDLAGIHDAIGLFINTLPARIRVPADARLSDWLASLQTQQASMIEYEYSSLVRIQAVSEIPRGVPLFDSILAFENYPIDASYVAAAPEAVRVDAQTVREIQRTNYPITLLASPADELSLGIIYDVRLFAAAAIERLIRQLETILVSMSENPRRRLWDLSLLTPDEQRQILLEWNNTAVDFGGPQTIHERFMQQARATPERIAYVADGQTITYGELNAKSNRMARYLMRGGVGPECLVGISMDRSIEMVTAILGVLKAGAAYVPFDQSYPRERLRQMAEDSRIEVVISAGAAVCAQVREVIGREVQLPREASQIERESGADVEVNVDGANTAYVIYTSGSTGRPKGVVGIHHGVLNRCEWMWKVFPFEEGEVCCQKTALSFVDSVWEIFGPLLKGCRTVVIPDEAVRDPDRLTCALAQEEVTRLVLVPSLLRLLLDSQIDLACRLPKLKHWICSGEALTSDLQRHFYNELPDRVLQNLYGCSEVSADVSFHDTRKSAPAHAEQAIGRPLANTRIYITDENMLPVPVGVPGELCVGGASLARGYLHRPDLTAERFIPDPFGAVPGGRLYRTGDVGYYCPEGTIVYVGRTDRQVKIRGFRIELHDVEVAVSEHPEVDEAIVVAWKRDGANELAAYCVCKGQRKPTVSDLRAFLQARLQSYMVPSTFVILEGFPLTPNGKIDRLALPPPSRSVADSGTQLVSPATDLEATMVEVWREVLGLERVGVMENFFDAGGNSLLIVNAHNLLVARLGIEFPLVTMFQYPTIRALADHLADGRRQNSRYETSAARGRRRRAHRPSANSVSG